MKYQFGEFEARHENPIWRDCADFILSAFLGTKDGRNEWEQLWAKRISTTRFKLCCIPFFAKDLALGDEVETDSDFVVQRVVLPSGNYTFHAWLGGQPNDVRTKVLKKLEAINADMEWSSENLVALSAPSDRAQGLADCLASFEAAGELQYETGRS